MRPIISVSTLLATLIALAGSALAHDEERGKRSAKTLSQREIAEAIDGKKSVATTVELTLEPGHAGSPHRHPGPTFGYVLEGEYEWAINDQPVQLLKAGDTFYEPTLALHRVSRNPSDKNKTRVIAMVIHPQDVKNIVLPEKKK